MPYLRLHRAPDDGAQDSAEGPLHFTAATAGVKADGIDLADLPWDFSRGVGGGAGNGRYPFLWVHDMAGDRLPLGVVDVLTAPDKLPLRIAVHFDPDDDFAQKVARKYRSPVGGLEAVSVSWDDVDEAGIPARASGKKPVAHQLLEVSAVPVGLDPLALQEGERVAMRSLLADLQDALARSVDGQNALEGARGALPPHETPKASEDTAWNGPAVVAALPSERDALRRAMAWVDPDGNPDAKSSYKLPHHLPDGRVVWRGVAAAMGALMGSMGGVEIPDGDREGVRRHLATHYRQFDREPPEPRGTGGTMDHDTDIAADARDDSEVWADTAAAMVDVFARDCELSESKRRRAYRALVSQYQRLGKVWPEFTPADELRALDDDNWRALFLSGELDILDAHERVGAELSGRNVEELTAAAEAIQSGLDRIVSILDRVAPKQVKKSETVGEGDDEDEGERVLATVPADSLEDVDLTELADYLDNREAASASEDDDNE